MATATSPRPCALRSAQCSEPIAPLRRGFSSLYYARLLMFNSAPKTFFGLVAMAGFLIFLGWNPAYISCEPQETNIQCAERARDLANR